MQIKQLEQRIISVLLDSESPLQLLEISKRLRIPSESREYKTLKNVLQQLCDSGILIKLPRRRFSLSSFVGETLVRGTLRIQHGKGLVFVNGKKEPITIKRKNLFTALDGDRVVVKLLGFKKHNRQYGEIIEIISRSEHYITGTIEYDANLYFLIPDSDKYYLDLLIPPSKLNNAKNGDKVRAHLVSWDNPHKSPIAEVIEILGRSGDTSSESETIIHEFNLPQQFPESVEYDADAIHVQVPRNEIRRRVDLRKKLIITIDPIDAKDFDDAVSLEFLPNGNCLLGVHIADVSYYVQEKSEIDREAFRRGTSVYLVDKVVPMLPEKLSNNLCSLRPNRVRLTYSVQMEFDGNFNLVDYQIFESVIKSRKRLTYDRVLEILTSNRQPKNEIEELLHNLNNVAQNLRKKRLASGGINFETVEVKFVLDESKNPIGSYLKESNIATQLIEECMLAANKTVAEHIQLIKKKLKLKTELPFVYRIHEEPEKDKIKGVLFFFKFLGIESKNLTSAKAINRFLQKFEGKPEKPIVHQLLIRAMQKAQYSADNIGHYGLGFRFYTHFTSPIRRYPDLVVHRLLKKYNSNQFKESDIAKLRRLVDIVSEQSSDREIIAMEAERESIKLMQSILASQNLGKAFYGTISGVTNFGFFVVLDELYAEGLVPVRDLLDDYYIYDEKNLCLVGRRKRRVFRFGDRVYVSIVESSIEKRKITLRLVD